MLLFEGQCRWSTGALERVGRVEVDASGVRFTPSRLDQFLGARSWEVLFPDLIGLSRVAQEATLQLESSSARYRLVGPPVAEIDAAVRKALGTHPAFAPAAPQLQFREEILVSAPVVVSRHGGPERAGSLTLTQARVIFSHRGVHRLEAGLFGFDLQRASLKDVRLEGDRLQLLSSEGSWTLAGAAVALLFPLLCAWDEDRALVAGGYRVREATRVSPPPTAHGRMAITARWFRFQPAGGEVSEIPLWEISRAQLSRGSSGDRLSIRQGQRSWMFDLPQAASDLGELVRLMAALEVAGEPPTDPHGIYGEAAVVDILAPWTKELPGLTPGRVAIAGPGVLSVRRDGARRGAIVLFDQGLLFLPWGGLGGDERRFAAPLTALVPPTSDDADDSTLTLLPRVGEPMVWAPRGGAEFLVRFVPLFRRLSNSMVARVGAPTRNRRNSYRSHAPEGTTVVVRVEHPEGSWQMQSFLIDLSAEGCQIGSDVPIPEGSHLEVEVATSHEVLKVRADVVRTTTPSLVVPEWRYGLRFVRMDPETERRMRQMAMVYQAYELSVRREE